MMRRLSWHIPFLLAGVAILHGGVVHRYSFDGEGKAAIDSIGGKHGTMTGGVTLKGEGFVELDGSNDLIELPAGLISKLNNLTIETWVVWRGPSTSQWQNVLLFGNGSSHWMYLTPNAQKKARFAVAGGGAERKAFATAPITSDGTTVTHLAVTIDGGADTAFFYLDGVQKGSVTRIPDLSSFEDTANFIGKPLYRGFPSFNGRILEVRIHDKVLSSDKMKRSFDFGPDMLLGPAINLFQADNEVVQSNSEVTFIWEASAESKVTIEPGVISNAANTGSATVNVLESTSFTLTAVDEDGARSSRITIVVDDRPIIKSFNASADGIQKIGDKVNLSWDISPADFVQIKPDAPAISGLTGSVQVPIRATTEFTLLARNRHGSSLATVEVVMPEVGPLKISEFVADNDEAHADDHGEYPDWIEIRNVGTPATIQNVELFGFNVDWRYNDENENLPANWARSAHGVGGDWTLAGAPIGRESSVLPEPLVTDLNPTFAAGTVTYYFERDFNLTEQQLAGAESLEITHQIDDGAIFYLNGIKAGSFNMAGNAVNPETLANPTVGNAAIETLSISADSLVKGTNRLSVEVHQSSTGSSDIVFGVKLDLRFLLTPTGPAPSTVDLSRWSLTDSAKNLKMWTFPAGTTLSSGARLVVYASGKDARGPKGNYHTNFKLDPSKGGYLALVRDDGLVGSIYSDYPAQRENISYGLLESGKLPAGSKAGDYGFFTTPTPKHINQDGYLDFVKDGFEAPEKKLARTKDEDFEWINAIRNGGPLPLSNFSQSGPFSETVLLGNVAIRSGEKIIWDAKNLKAKGNPGADRYIRRKYRKGWELPV